jgi:hypothetical protein
MGERLETFLKGPKGGKGSPVTWSNVSRLFQRNRVDQPVAPADLERCLNGLMMPAQPPSGWRGPDSARVLAGLFFIRNLTSHRFPIVVQGVREPWFEIWGKHLAAINRTVTWSGLALWALVKCFR